MDDTSEEMDADELEIIISEQLVCDCPNPKAHKRTCQLNSRNVSRKLLFPKIKMGDAVLVHFSWLPEKHLACRVAQVAANKHTLHCPQGTLSKRFVAQELQLSDERHDISLSQWRQSPTVNIRQLSNESFIECHCQLQTPSYITIEQDEDEGKQTAEVTTPLYSLTKSDMDTVRKSTGWLTDNVIAASQQVLAQQFPHVAGLESPALQQERGFTIHSGEFVQVVNVNKVHWCVISTVGCPPGQVNIYDTMLTEIQDSLLPIIGSLICPELNSLEVRMMDVHPQSNSSDCGPLSIAIAYDLCSGNDPTTVVYDRKQYRHHLETSLLNCGFTRFPTTETRAPVRVSTPINVPLHCTCRRPDEEDLANPYVACSSCSDWYHQHCLDVPKSAVGTEEIWLCPKCARKQ